MTIRHAHSLPLHPSPFSPSNKPVPTILPSRHGYTARRDSEAGSARGVGKRRKTSRTGPAENGLPPATWGKRWGVGPILSFHASNGAPDVPVRHTRRPGLADASASSAGREHAGRPKPSVGVARACGRDVKTAMDPSGNRRTTSTIPAFAEGSESQAKTAERGAERCHIQYIKRGSFQRPVRNAL